MSASSAEIESSDSAVTPQLFVINLCASTSPMALSQPNTPELKRYTFFVSRQREDGRERFRLHMGYFESQDDAEQLLVAVRDIYPAAWAGPAPTSGVPRRNRVVVKPVAAAAQPAPQPAPQAVEPPPVPIAAEPVEAPDLLGAMSNVRDVIAQLDETNTRLEMPSDAQISSLSERDVLQVLEDSEKSAAKPLEPLELEPAAASLDDADSNSSPCFAVQLVWSVSPIDAARLPHLAIFDAYTLYNVEGSRDGRKWYGVRLGFFSDPGAASQVANYVRSDYRAVAVVPVAIRERDGAGGGNSVKENKAAPLADASKAPKTSAPPTAALVDSEGLAGFELLADDRPAPIKHDIGDKSAVATGVAVPVAKPVPERAAAARVAGKPVGKPVGKRAVARKRPPIRPGAADPLESTLEILGASTLTLDEGRTIINDSAIRAPVDRKPAAGRFAKLLGRLSGN
jgi:hypothetical protein